MSLLSAAAEIAAFLDSLDVPYAILGGMAVQYWGEPRNTLDVDLVVMIAPEAADDFLRRTVKKFRPRILDAVDFAMRNRVLLIQASDDTPIDMSLGIPGYESDVMHRAKIMELEGRSLRVISAEDLIIHKLVAGRPRDLEDIERVFIRQQLRLDIAYIRGWVAQFAELIDERDLLSDFERELGNVQRKLRTSR